MADAKPRHQPGERNLRRVRHPAEHGFTEEGPAQLHAIKAAYQQIVMPAFDRMGVTHRVKAEGRALDRRVDPGFLAIGAGQQDLVKCLIAGDPEAAGTDAPRQRTGQVKPIERDDCPAARFDPENIASVTAVGHREYAGGISAQQHSRIQALTHRI